MSDLRHENFTELAEFARAWNDDLRENTGKIKDAYKMLSPTLVTALRQFIMEVKGYGVGISGMSARDWFNDDGIRRPYADAIASVYEAYQRSEAAVVEEVANPIETELKAMRDMLEAQAAEIAKLKEGDAVADAKPEPAEAAPDKPAEEGVAVEEPAKADDEEADADTENKAA